MNGTHRHDLEIVSHTDPGRVRPFNEDCVAVDAASGIAALADGMAKRRGAEVASRLATTHLIDALRKNATSAPDRVVREAFAAANQAICAQAEADPAMRGMGTTLIALWFRGERVSIAHVGDSRLYRFRGAQLERLTIDHSFIQEQLVAGTLTDDEARTSQSRQLVTRALGTLPAVAPDLSEHEVQHGDIYLLCSDGLHDLVEDTDIALALELLHPDLDLAASTLVAMANDRGGLDNISVVLVKVRQASNTRSANTVPGSRRSTFSLFDWIRSFLAK